MSPYVCGRPRIGKSSLIQAAAAADGVPCEVVIGSLREPSNFAVLPVVTEEWDDRSEGRAHFYHRSAVIGCGQSPPFG